MHKLFKIFTLLLAVTFTLSAGALQRGKREKKETAPEVVTIYAFGVCQDLSDSIVYVTSTAPINGATLYSHGLLLNRIHYSDQLKKYVEETYHRQHQSAAIFYFRKRKDADKAFARMQSRMQKHSPVPPVFRTISYTDFHFKVPVIVTADGEDDF